MVQSTQHPGSDSVRLPHAAGLSLRAGEPALPASASSHPVERRHQLPRQALRCRVHSEFIEMRGMRITLPQLQRLFGLREDICTRVLQELLSQGVLIETSDGRFGRRDAA